MRRDGGVVVEDEDRRVGAVPRGHGLRVPSGQITTFEEVRSTTTYVRRRWCSESAREHNGPSSWSIGEEKGGVADDGAQSADA